MPLREEHHKSINAQWASIQLKMDKLQILRKKLNCSLAIQELWPDVFDNSPVKSYFVGNTFEIREMRFKIESGIREREFNIFAVPEILIDRQIELQLEKADSQGKEIWEKFRIKYKRIKSGNDILYKVIKHGI